MQSIVEEKETRMIEILLSSMRPTQLLAGKILALMKGRFNVSVEDIKEAAYPAMRHRLIRNFEGEAEGISADAIVKDLIAAVPDVPKRVEKLLAAA